ncbi:MAG TPA: DoxX family protein [Polyangiaceae bacterium]
MKAVPRESQTAVSGAPRRWRRSGSLRLIVGIAFVAAGSSKLLASATTAAIVASRNLPVPMSIGRAVALFEIVSGVLLIAAWQTQWVTLALAGLVAVGAGMFHLPVMLAGPRALEIGVDAGVLVALYLIAKGSRARDRR